MKPQYQIIAAAFAVSVISSVQLMAASVPAPAPEFRSSAQLRKDHSTRSGPTGIDQKMASDSAIFYTGKIADSNSGSYIFLFRGYDPELSRWRTADPSGFPDGLNNSVYIGNAPVCAIDYLGLERVEIHSGTDMHVENCQEWSRDMGDGKDWKTWYTSSNNSVFFMFLGATEADPTVAWLAQNFVLTQLGLTAAGDGATTWTAYAGLVDWKVYKEEKEHEIVYDFEFETREFEEFTRTPGTVATRIGDFQPTKTSGKLTASIPVE